MLEPVRDSLFGLTAAALLESVQEQVERHRRQLRQQVQTDWGQGSGGRHCPEAIVLDYLDRYREDLFGHPLARDGQDRAIAVVERTNNPAEHSSSQAECKPRRRLGRAHLGRDMQDQPAQVALAANLREREYVTTLCRTLDGLPQAFDELLQSEQATVRPDRDSLAEDSASRRRVSQCSKESDKASTPSEPASVSRPLSRLQSPSPNRG